MMKIYLSHIVFNCAIPGFRCLIPSITSKLLMTFCVRDKIQKNDLEFGSILKRLKLQMKLNVSIVVRFTIIMQEKQVLHLFFIIYIVVNPIWRLRIRMTYLN